MMNRQQSVVSFLCLFVVGCAVTCQPDAATLDGIAVDHLACSIVPDDDGGAGTLVVDVDAARLRVKLPDGDANGLLIRERSTVCTLEAVEECPDVWSVRGECEDGTRVDVRVRCGR